MALEASTIEVFVIAEHKLAGAYLVQVLNANNKKHPCVEAVLCEHLPVRLKPKPLVFVIDKQYLALPLRECIQRLLSVFPKSRFIIVCTQQEKKEIASFLKVGAHGIVQHSAVPAALREAVIAVAQGQLWITSEVFQSYIELTSKIGEPDQDLDVPTEREMEVLDLLRQRRTNKEIARLLGVRESTVKYHISNIFGKLRVCSRHDILESSWHKHDLWESLSKHVTTLAGNPAHKPASARPIHTEETSARIFR